MGIGIILWFVWAAGYVILLLISLHLIFIEKADITPNPHPSDYFALSIPYLLLWPIWLGAEVLK